MAERSERDERVFGDAARVTGTCGREAHQRDDQANDLPVTGGLTPLIRGDDRQASSISRVSACQPHMPLALTNQGSNPRLDANETERTKIAW